MTSLLEKVRNQEFRGASQAIDSSAFVNKRIRKLDLTNIDEFLFPSILLEIDSSSFLALTYVRLSTFDDPSSLSIILKSPKESGNGTVCDSFNFKTGISSLENRFAFKGL